ncbi:glycoside hydrolase family 26 protein [Pseudohyphozyma bogoriensis]|nr:glycoside hydrolase family 26 protein [Pseudohyphozyma bogoriensis]
MVHITSILALSPLLFSAVSAVAHPQAPPQGGPGCTASTNSTGWGLSGVSKNGIYFGFLPDDGSGGGTAQTISAVASSVGLSMAPAQGYYAQAESGTTFTGSQLTDKFDEIVANGGVFQPAVMPTGGWSGLTTSDNSQAVAICDVMKTFVDAGLEVWLRFAHEVNWYLSDGTYSGTVDDFKEGWSVVAAACQPLGVKMWFTPNVADLATYQEYFPDDVSTVDIIGVDYYPTTNSPTSTDFLNEMQSFHDAYCSESLAFAIGETGLGQEATIAQRLSWAEAITSSTVASAMPYYIAASWFNYDKGYVFSIADTDGDSVTKAWLA